MEYLNAAEAAVEAAVMAASKLKILFHDNYFVGDVSWQAD